MASGWWLLGQVPRASELVGGLLLLLGAYVALRPRRAASPARVGVD